VQTPSHPDVHQISGVSTSITAFVGFSSRGPVNQPTPVRSFADYERAFGGLSAESTMSFAVSQFFMNGGREALIVRATDGSTTPVTSDLVPLSDANKTGIWALDEAELFNLLCIPPLSRDAALTTAERATAAAYCKRRRALYLVDPDSAWDDTVEDIPTRLAAFSADLDRENAALFFPRLRMADDTAGGALAVFPPCGAVAGVIARSDQTWGIWRAPAGQAATLRGTAGLTVNLTSSEISLLNQLGVNCLRTFPTVGPVVWGSRTLAGNDALASDWKYLPVRRVALFIEESLYRGTKWAVFEPNDPLLWAQLRVSVTSFMDGLFRRGAFQGLTPAEAYFVKCDEETTTQADIEAEIVNIVVGFAPLKPAEFVAIRIQQLADCFSA
jgi:Bacteriophage tail sheath protein